MGWLIVAKGSERVNVSDHFWYRIVLGKAIKLLLLPVVKESLCLTRQPSDCVNVDGGAAHNVFVAVSFIWRRTWTIAESRWVGDTVSHVSTSTLPLLWLLGQKVLIHLLLHFYSSAVSASVFSSITTIMIIFVNINWVVVTWLGNFWLWDKSFNRCVSDCDKAHSFINVM